jgi:methylated-DNA-[protein]-cysteine S-methyltransferase
MTGHWSTLDTPIGPFTTIVDHDEAVLASGFTADVNALLRLVHPSLQPATQPQPRADLGAVTKAALAYLDGEVDAIDAIAVQQRSSGAFLPVAWDALRRVPAGQTVTYAGFAELAGRASAIRAAAAACARNAAALFVPCHRVLRSDGTLGGFRYGLPVKRWLLEHESAAVTDR